MLSGVAVRPCRATDCPESARCSGANPLLRLRLAQVGNQYAAGRARDDFSAAAAAISAARLRPEIRVSEAPAPTRIAPDALALTCDVVDPQDPEESLATGRFVLLHDPASPEPWEGPWRVVTFARADLDPELATDPVLADVGWSWLTDALRDAGLDYVAESGTVTCVVSQGYGGLAQEGPSVDMEVRASWTPSDPTDLAGHLQAWTDLLGMLAGLEPLPDGVVALPSVRR